ncbi:hypothetical protein DFH11DRAFT_220751 [Phellopilus nigrolimitatus]|nr:hypothetical protein DFH11DRAFT_220751 [Phellopilus nigrolimitatus]
MLKPHPVSFSLVLHIFHYTQSPSNTSAQQITPKLRIQIERTKRKVKRKKQKKRKKDVSPIYYSMPAQSSRRQESHVRRSLRSSGRSLYPYGRPSSTVGGGVKRKPAARRHRAQAQRTVAQRPAPFPSPPPFLLLSERRRRARPPQSVCRARSPLWAGRGRGPNASLRTSAIPEAWKPE